MRNPKFIFQNVGYFIHIIKLIQLVAAYSDSNSYNYANNLDYQDSNSYSVQQPQQCGVPNIIRGQKIDPEKLVGVWYAYSAWFPNITQDSVSVNTINYYTSLGQGHFPTTDLPASIFIQEQTFYPLDDTTCRYLHDIAYITVDGRQIGLFFNLTNTDAPVAIDDTIAWSTDYDTYAFFHSCFGRQPTGLCSFPYLYVNTRKKPQDITAAEKATINAAVNQGVQRYCLDAKDFVIFEWLDVLPSCPRTNGSSCFQSLRTAFQGTVES
ncbi:uncharacterized protein LOC129594817 [Paramacrobiotus metropolitanus]|uniref:uncharacterized protein LOC129594817 n=1 Tax=Paramacrobiotus metropolitanus TaxID=2943436 RepID=UPI0024458249|nr:uncharacterized protein LOC129594817 [Paramacrobiotus metropolitanus]